jgi:hypothetical protein
MVTLQLSLLLLLLLVWPYVCAQVAAVIGVDNVEMAIADACVNAELNGITNATFVTDTAENAMEALLKVCNKGCDSLRQNTPSCSLGGGSPIHQNLLPRLPSGLTSAPAALANYNH